MIERLVAVVVPEGVHTMPSVDVNTWVPPNTTNLPRAAPDSGGVAVGLRSIQTAPSVELRILPARCAVDVFVYVPTAAKRPAPCATPDKLATGRTSGRVQVTPSDDVAMAPIPEVT